MPHRSIHWFRRDLRVADNPALLSAVAEGTDGVLPLYVIDPTAWEATADVRKAYLMRSLASLNESLETHLTVRVGDPCDVILKLAQEVQAGSVHYAADFTQTEIDRDSAVAKQLENRNIEVTVVGSPYAVAPGRVRNGDGSPYRVYTPFYRAWLAHRWRAPVGAPRNAGWIRTANTDPLPTPTTDVALPVSGEHAAAARWESFKSDGLDDYAAARNRTDLDGTSHMSVHLGFGEIHPRTLLADLGGSKPHEAFRKELAWREFYADVLLHQPESADSYLRREFAGMAYDHGAIADHRLAAWQQGRTGYPMVDAAMRQLLREGWMHNRARMIVASFFVKDLHLQWQQGAEWFMTHLIDGDVASNSHGWQWTAGTGTDAAPYFRIFNPVTQGLKFDPCGDYVRSYIPELRHLEGVEAHQPWKSPHGYRHNYPHRIVDHPAERVESLTRFEAIKNKR